MFTNKKTCCFFGHREVTHNIREKLKATIEKLITEDGVTEFYIGHQGQFDSMVYSVLKELKANYPQIRYTVVLAYMPDEHIKEVYGEDTLFPDGMENVPKKFAISKRNDWMIQQSDFAVCYVYKVTGGATKLKEKAEKKGLQIIDCFDGSAADVLNIYSYIIEYVFEFAYRLFGGSFPLCLMRLKIHRSSFHSYAHVITLCGSN